MSLRKILKTNLHLQPHFLSVQQINLLCSSNSCFLLNLLYGIVFLRKLYHVRGIFYKMQSNVMSIRHKYENRVKTKRDL